MVADFLLMKSATLTAETTVVKSEGTLQPTLELDGGETSASGFDALFQQAAGEMDEAAAVVLPGAGKLLPQRQGGGGEEAASVLLAKDLLQGREEGGIPVAEPGKGLEAIPATDMLLAEKGEDSQAGVAHAGSVKDSAAGEKKDPRLSADGWFTGENAQGSIATVSPAGSVAGLLSAEAGETVAADEKPAGIPGHASSDGLLDIEREAFFATESVKAAVHGNSAVPLTVQDKSDGGFSPPALSMGDQPVKEGGSSRSDKGAAEAGKASVSRGFPLYGQEMPARDRDSFVIREMVAPGSAANPGTRLDSVPASEGEHAGPAILLSRKEWVKPDHGARAVRARPMTTGAPVVTGSGFSEVVASAGEEPSGSGLPGRDGHLPRSVVTEYPAAMQTGSRFRNQLAAMEEEMPSPQHSRGGGLEQSTAAGRAVGPQPVASGSPLTPSVQSREEGAGKRAVSLQPSGAAASGPAGSQVGQPASDTALEFQSRAGAFPEGNEASMPDPQGMVRGVQISASGGAAQPASPTTAQPAMVEGMIEEPLGHEAWEKSMARQLINLASEGEQRVTLRLNPSNLGPLDVRIVTEEGEARVQFSSQQAVVREAVETALPRLRDLFQGSGLNLVEVDVSRQDSSAQQQAPGRGAGREQEQGARAGSQSLESTDTAPASAATAVGDRLIDYYA